MRTGSGTSQERQYIQGQRAGAVIGGPQLCKERLLELAARYSADELMVLTITGDYATRLDSYERLAQAFALGRPPAQPPGASSAGHFP